MTHRTRSFRLSTSVVHISGASASACFAQHSAPGTSDMYAATTHIVPWSVTVRSEQRSGVASTERS